MKRVNAYSQICLYLTAVFFFQACKKQETATLRPNALDSTPIITSVLNPVTFSINNKIGGYYVALPSNYNQTAEYYPLLLYIHGAGQFGNGSLDLPLLLNDGPAELVDEKKFPGTFRVNDKNYSLIVLTPQTKTFPSIADITDCIKFAKTKYRIDSTRIYLSGLSIGSIAICNTAAEIPSEIAAIVTMAGVPPDYATTDKCQKIAASNLPVWSFHSEDDRTIDVSNTKGFIAKLISYSPAITPKLTIWKDGGHDAWTRALNPSYKEDNMNIYEWMLQYHR
jgi:predicted peptidase